jgi:hypothetical protein
MLSARFNRNCNDSWAHNARLFCFDSTSKNVRANVLYKGEEKEKEKFLREN